MTKKHFIELADYLRKPGMMPAAIEHAINQAQVDIRLHCSEAVEPGDAIPLLTDSQQNRLRREVILAITRELADFCRNQNPRFNRDTFYGYVEGTCGPSGGKVKTQ